MYTVSPHNENLAAGYFFSPGYESAAPASRHLRAAKGQLPDHSRDELPITFVRSGKTIRCQTGHEDGVSVCLDRSFVSSPPTVERPGRRHR